jgi:hypothetical protein
MGKLASYESKQPSSQLLKQGEHDVKLLGYTECTSFDEIKSLKVIGQKADLPSWINPVDVLAIWVGNATGSMTYRLHLEGCLRYSELSDKQLKSGQYQDEEGFACEITKKGLVRIEDPERTAVCESILDRFIWALGYPEGTNALEALDQAMASKSLFHINVVAEPWEDGDDQLRIKKFTRISEDAPKASAGLEA